MFLRLAYNNHYSLISAYLSSCIMYNISLDRKILNCLIFTHIHFKGKLSSLWPLFHSCQVTLFSSSISHHTIVICMMVMYPSYFRASSRAINYILWPITKQKSVQNILVFLRIWTNKMVENFPDGSKKGKNW